jgi:hypothetical protein
VADQPNGHLFFFGQVTKVVYDFVDRLEFVLFGLCQVTEVIDHKEARTEAALGVPDVVDDLGSLDGPVAVHDADRQGVKVFTRGGALLFASPCEVAPHLHP